jgi:acid phosphatase type 7
VSRPKWMGSPIPDMRGRPSWLVLAASIVIIAGACGPGQAAEPTTSPSVAPTATPVSPSPPTSSPSEAASPTPTAVPDAVLLTAGDIAACSKDGDSATAAILARYPDAAVQTLGDNAYDKGTHRQFGCYHDTWGIALERTKPALGGHDYMTEGAAGYFGYFKDVLAPFAPTGTDPTMGWYAYELGAWRIIVLNSICDRIGGCDAASKQVAWLRSELAENPSRCSLAVIHNPRFSSGRKENEPRVQPLWEALHSAGAEVVLSGDNHAYERLAPMTPTGERDAAGIRQFVVGTGGRSHYSFSDGAIHPNTEVGDDQTYGVLMLTLGADGYGWEFLPEAGKSFTDTGSEACH